LGGRDYRRTHWDAIAFPFRVSSADDGDILLSRLVKLDVETLRLRHHGSYCRKVRLKRPSIASGTGDVPAKMRATPW
jgi:hypothetical protein